MLSRIKPPFNKFISIDLFQNLTAMANYLGQTMSPDREVRKGAEEFLRSVEGQQGYPILLLTLLNKENVDISIKIAASITFKNFIKRNWKVVSIKSWGTIIHMYKIVPGTKLVATSGNS